MSLLSKIIRNCKISKKTKHFFKPVKVDKILAFSYLLGDILANFRLKLYTVLDTNEAMRYPDNCTLL